MATIHFYYTNNQASTNQTFYFRPTSGWQFVPIQPHMAPSPVASLPATVEECQHELDIIRGIVPTPKGYIVDKSRVRLLMLRIKELS